MAGTSAHGLRAVVPHVGGLITALLLAFPVVMVITYTVCYMIYNVYFHPLRQYPGPKWWAASRVPWIWRGCSGRLHEDMLELHKQYGAVVRIAPKELSYTTATAWKQMSVLHDQIVSWNMLTKCRYGQRSVEMMKDLRGAGILPTFKGVESIITADRKDHSRMRRTVSHAFSEKAIREQELTLQKYVDQMISKLRDRCRDGPQDLVSWFNWCTFDVMGDLAFGEPFGCLEEAHYHEWVKMIFNGVKGYPWIQGAMHFNLMSLIKYITPKHLADAKQNADANAYEKTERRLSRKTDRKDFMSYILRHNDEKGMTKHEIQETAVILIIAGSETTATFLSGAIYYALTHPRVYERLVAEIRSTFASYEEIDSVKTNALKYMPAVTNEVFRIYPPSPNTLPRIVPGEGESIDGQWVPGDTTAGVNQYAAYHDASNFYRPNDFLPERWLPESLHREGDVPAESFAQDQKEVLQPFSFGPRNCIGKNLAYAELRIILSKLLWTFDLELDAQHVKGSWADQETYVLWEKPALMVHLTPVKRSV